MSLLLLLSNTSVGVAQETKAAGGYDDKPKRKRYVVKIDGSLVQFSSKAMAIEALERTTEQPEVKPIATVPIQAIKELAIERQADDVFQKHLDAMKYLALLALYEQWQDEQDIEDLLMLAY